MSETTEITSALSAGSALGQPKHTGSSGHFAVVPNGYRLEDLEKLEPTPSRIRQTINARSASSFIEYVNKYKADSTSIFADVRGTSFKCVIDYHGPTYPLWGDHVAKYSCPLSRSWMAWVDANKKPKTQTDFAQFIEDNLPDIQQPNGSDLLTISRTLEAKKKVDFESAVRLDNGERQFTYNEEIKGTAGKGTIDIPETFVLGIPVFEGGAPYRLEARLRYRIQDGDLRMWFDLLRPDRLVDDAFAQLIEHIKSETKDVAIFEADI